MFQSWSGNSQNVRGSHFAVPAFQDLKPLASFSARKSGSKSFITSLGFTSTTETIHPTYFTTHRQKQHKKRDSIISGLDVIPDKVCQVLFYGEEEKTSFKSCIATSRLSQPNVTSGYAHQLKKWLRLPLHWMQFKTK